MYIETVGYRALGDYRIVYTFVKLPCCSLMNDTEVTCSGFVSR